MVAPKLRQRATITDVARMAGVSIATVSRVMNTTAPVAASTKARVIDAVDKLGYMPQAAARSLAGRKTNTIGLLLPEIGGAFYPPMLRGIESRLREAGFDLLIYSSSSQLPDDNSHHPQPFGIYNTDGLLVFTNRLSDVEIERLYLQGFPIVLLHRSPPDGLDVPYVTFENKSGAQRIVDHLITVHGCRRIGYLTGPEGNEDSNWRELGYREALKAHDIPFDPALVVMGGFNDIRAQLAVEQWLRDGVELDAIFAGDDEAAAGVIIALRRAGLDVPEDVAVVGFDDVPFATYLLPPLTTVRAPIERAGELAAEQIIQLIQTGEAHSFTFLPTTVVIRQSCGCR